MPGVSVANDTVTIRPMESNGQPVLVFGLDHRGSVCVGEKEAVERSAEIIAALRPCRTYADVLAVANRFPDELAQLREDWDYEKPNPDKEVDSEDLREYWLGDPALYILDLVTPEQMDQIEALGGHFFDGMTGAGSYIPGELADQIEALLAEWGYQALRDDALWLRADWDSE